MVVLFTKPARPGRVKTRMTPHYTAAEACSLHDALLRDVLAQTAVPEASYELVVAWAVDEGEALPDVGDWVASPAPRVVRQSGNDLGERLVAALGDQCTFGAERVAAIGSDHPELDRDGLEAAFAGLDDHDCVLAPAQDGGYSLIALRCEAVVPALFEGIDWSTPRVLEQTLSRLEGHGLSALLLEVIHDIDEPADLEALARRLAASSGPARAVATLAWFEEHGR